jgi:hypothetical protein
VAVLDSAWGAGATGAQAAKLQRLESEANADVAALRQVLSAPAGTKTA